ncbi:MAG: methyltransferase [Candidatus Nanoarchaeia archaeon]
MTQNKAKHEEKTFDEDIYNDYVFRSNEKKAIITKIRSLLDSKHFSCLEIGLGTSAEFAFSLSNLFKKYTIVEKEQINIPLPENAELINADWETIKITQKYDLIIASHVVYYFNDKKQAIKKMFDSLNPGGKVIFVVNDRNSDYGNLKSEFFKLLKEDYEFTYDTLKAILKDYTFQEFSVSSNIVFQTHEELFNSLKLFFDTNQQTYIELKDQIISYLKTSKEKSNSFNITHAIFVCNNKWDILLNHAEHNLKINDLSLTINTGVFTPDPSLTFSSTQLLESMPNVKDKKVLDMGCGTGIIGISCLKNGASEVVFVDNNESALKNTQINLNSHNLSLNSKVIRSDLFSNINQKFDYIFANLPISKQLWAGEKDSENIILNFLIECQHHINFGGEVFFTWASFESSENIKLLLEKLNYKYTISTKDALNHSWYLYKISF